MPRNRESGGLRQGFTTGSAAAAAAKAALTLLLGGETPATVDVPLPGEDAGRLTIPVEEARPEGRGARAVVVKDAGDDPDATHGARIGCLAVIEGMDGREPPGVEVVIEGGGGVGRVTLPGLPVPVGMAAINPAPREQIERAAREALRARGVHGRVLLIIEVEGGEEIARRTLNPRLGIIGGISILGTQGIVKPYSHAAWEATIGSGLAVARAAGIATAAFSTGRRSERLLMRHRPDLPQLAFIQAADFFAHSLRQASSLDFSEMVWGCFFGKLAKMAQGVPYTHAHAEPVDFALLAEMAGQAGAAPETCARVARANTARHALEIVPEGALREGFAARTAARALEAARSFAGAGPRLSIVCFGFESGVLAEAYAS
uniref:Cobalt-precorrin-5B C(1)-methyltransferase n=1 Tax=Fundidesulfovibrio putealis TaxID=270496 RepID=A0A7C4AGQ1_9BACT